MSLPNYKPSDKLPEGHYRFTISKPPEKRKTGNDKIFIRFYFTAHDSTGETQNHMEGFFPWTSRYGDLLLALGGERDEKGEVHLSGFDEDDLVGKRVRADIEYEADQNDTQKTWARMINIKSMAADPDNNVQDDEVPF